MDPGTTGASNSFRSAANSVSSIRRSVNSSRQTPSAVAPATRGPRGLRNQDNNTHFPFRYLPGGIAERPGERIAEAAVGLVPALEDGGIECPIFSDPVQGSRQPPGSGERLEGHAIPAEEVAPNRARVDPPCPQVAVRDPRRRVPLHVDQQGGRPWRLIIQLQRPAPLARAVSGHQGGSRGREVLNALRQRLPCRTGRAAKDSGRANAEEEQAIVGGVSFEIRPLHLGGLWHGVHASSLLGTPDRVPPNFGRGCQKLRKDSPGLAEWRAGGPSIRAARSAAAGGWNARPDADSVQPTAHQFPSIPHRAATAPLNPVSTPSAACGQLM